jgi:hypothetical protein
LKQHKQSRKCNIKSLQFISNKSELLPVSSPASSSVPTTTDERMRISWLLIDSSDSDISSDINDCKSISSSYYYY